MKTNYPLLTGFAALLCLLAPQPGDATTLVRMSLDDLAARASVVVRARCVASESEVSGGEIWTRTTLEVSESFKGGPPRTLVVRMLGGRAGHLISFVEGIPRFAPGEDVFLFLESLPVSRGSSAQEWAVSGWSQGSFRVVRDRATENISVWQDTAGLSLYDPVQKQFSPGGVRRIPLHEFRRRIQDAVERVQAKEPEVESR